MYTDDIQRRHQELLSNYSYESITDLFAQATSPGIEDGHLQNRVVEIKEFLGFMTLPIASKRLYRARYWSNQSEYPKRVFELLQPPEDYTGLGRCNLEKKPILYLADHPLALPVECRFEPGVVFAMIQFDREKKTEDLSCFSIGVDPYLKFSAFSAMDKIDQFLRSFTGEHYEKYKFFESQLHTLFVKESYFSNGVYRLTASICDSYLSTFSDIDAIYYPSIASHGAYNNFALRKGVYTKAYRASKAALFEVIDINTIRFIVGSRAIDGRFSEWNADTYIDVPVAVSGRMIDRDDPRIYIAPWRNEKRNT